MKNFWQIVKGFFIILALLVVFYLALRNQYSLSLFDIPTPMVSLAALMIVFYIGYCYIDLFLNKNQIESEFTTIVNHTFRTPLTRINWISKALEDPNLEKEERLNYIQNLNNATNRLIEIVDLIAGIQKIGDKTGYTFEATSIRDIVEKAIVKYREDINKKNLSLQVPTFKDIPMLTIDLKKISFVIDSILENAIVYTPKDGKILIDCVSVNNKLYLSVADNGPGLSFTDRLKIFSRFFRSKSAILAYPDGMGLRLHLSKKIVERHGGKMFVKSKGKDQGSTFVIVLPFSR
ncbi:MAG: HAMP domain-containing sensor histidine kinase [bacterium]